MKEQIMEYVCDNLCKYPSEYKDPDDLWNEQCDHCKLMELLEQQNTIKSYEGKIRKLIDSIEELSKENESLGKDLTSAVEMLKKKRKPKWIPVSERLPKLHEEVIVCNEEYGRSELGFAMVAVWDGTDWIETWEKIEAIHCVTHWMPLPEPPKESEKDG